MKKRIITGLIMLVVLLSGLFWLAALQLPQNKQPQGGFLHNNPFYTHFYKMTNRVYTTDNQ